MKKPSKENEKKLEQGLKSATDLLVDAAKRKFYARLYFDTVSDRCRFKKRNEDYGTCTECFSFPHECCASLCPKCRTDEARKWL